MSGNPIRRRIGVVLGAVVLASALGVAVTVVCASCQVYACQLLAGPERRVALPGPDAAPEAVVRAYLEALVARDVDTMEKLAVPAFTERERSVVGAPYCNWQRIDGLVLQRAAAEGLERREFREVAAVWVKFRLTSRTKSGLPRDPEGKVDWGYLIGRNAPGERWRVFDSGAAL
ncbi:hypothetical protein OHA25_51180 [Nonomuraea sp. NBC_00507]|uniref:hypothetical protein n=1 Tax=Nonomuraea sp. NBC_00507 TaxID=2976002 RepID=UPI002E1861B1